MGKALITGGAGFMGWHLGTHLAKHGYAVDLLDNFARGVHDAEFAELVSRPRVRLIDEDLLEPGALRDLDTDYTHIVHLAAIVGVSRVAERPFAVLRENWTMLDHVLACARRQSSLQRFLFPSTSEVYAGAVERGEAAVPTPESAPITLPELRRPRTAYMASKIYGEVACHHAGVPYTIVRPHNVYGARMGLSHVIPELMKRAHDEPDGGTLQVYSVRHRRTFCYVEDAVEMLRRVLESDACEGETLNIGARTPEVTIGALAELVLATVGKSLTIQPLEETAGSPKRRGADMSRTAELTEYEARTSLEEGLQLTYSWYRDSVFDAVGASAH